MMQNAGGHSENTSCSVGNGHRQLVICFQPIKDFVAEGDQPHSWEQSLHQAVAIVTVGRGHPLQAYPGGQCTSKYSVRSHHPIHLKLLQIMVWTYSPIPMA